MSFEVELRLLLTVVLNAGILAVFWHRSGDVMKTLVLWLGIQYVALGVCGTVGQLSLWPVVGIAIGLTALTGWRLKPEPGKSSTPTWSVVLGTSLALAGVLGVYGTILWTYRVAPVMGDDPMTYHIPAAIQWTQDGRLGLFQTWFFNPANTFSPLGGSVLAAWWIVLMGDDVLARFFQWPALVLIGCAVYHLLAHAGASTIAAMLASAAALLSRPIVPQTFLAKDDLFVVAFSLASAVFLIRKEHLLAGVALGLLMSIKITAVFALPVVLLAIHKTCWNKLLFTVAIAGLLAGPWYARNFVLTGNPIFPTTLGPLPGLFNTAVAPELRCVHAIWTNLTGEFFSLPVPLLAAAVIGWLLLLVTQFKQLQSSPAHRVLLIAPILNIGLYLAIAPFAEVRFIAVGFALVIASVSCVRWPSVAVCGTCVLLLLAVLTMLDAAILLGFLPGILATAGVMFVVCSGVGAWLKLNPVGLRKAAPVMVGGVVLIVALWAFVEFRAYRRSLRDTAHVMWQSEKGQLAQGWAWLDQHAKDGSRIAFSSTSFVYPLYGPALSRRVMFVSPHPTINHILDFPRGDFRRDGVNIFRHYEQLPLEHIDAQLWVERLREQRIDFVLVGRPSPIEVVLNHPAFETMMSNSRCVIVRVK